MRFRSRWGSNSNNRKENNNDQREEDRNPDTGQCIAPNPSQTGLLIKSYNTPKYASQPKSFYRSSVVAPSSCYTPIWRSVEIPGPPSKPVGNEWTAAPQPRKPESNATQSGPGPAMSQKRGGHGAGSAQPTTLPKSNGSLDKRVADGVSPETWKGDIMVIPVNVPAVVL